MPLLGDGAAQLTQLDPGSLAWIAQVNANLLQLNNRYTGAIILTAGEALTAGNFVAVDPTTGKVKKASWNNSTLRRCIGIVLDSVALDASVRVHIGGPVSYVFAGAAGSLLYLTTAGGASTTPADAGTVARQLVVGMILPTRTIIFGPAAIAFHE